MPLPNLLTRRLVRCAGVAACALLAHGAPAQSPVSSARARRVADSLVTQFMATQPVPGLVAAVVRDRDTVLLAARGAANLEVDAPMRSSAVLRIGSITKQFTAVQVLQLVDSGRVALDDSIGRYLPTLPATWQGVTVRQLLNHTSGLPSYTSLGASWMRRWGEELAPDTIAALTFAQPLDFAPGSNWRYNNTGYVLLGMLVAQRTGRPWAQDLEQRLLRPLGLTDTRDCQNAPVLPRRASGYSRQGAGFVNAPYLAMTQPYAGGAMCSTVRDLLRWQRALHGGTLLSAASYAVMTTPEGEAAARGYGFGIERDTVGGRPMLAHGGGIPGFLSFGLYVPEGKVSVIVLTNGDAQMPDRLARQLARVALGAALDRGPRVSAGTTGTARATTAASPYVGRYALVDSASGAVVPLTVTMQDGVLTGQIRQNTPTRLEADGTHQFRPADAPEFRVRFTVQGERAVRAEVVGAGVVMRGGRDEGAAAGPAPSAPAVTPSRPPVDDETAAGPLFSAIATVDSALFTSAFVSCDTTAVFALLADSVEFYHDLTGARVGDEVRTDFRRLTGNCPARNGVRRVLVPGSMRVYPIKDFGAMQSGVHRFVQDGQAMVTEARFVHLWRREGERWRATRIVSVDHRTVPR